MSCIGFCATAGTYRGACLGVFSARFLILVYLAQLLERFFLFIVPSGLHRSCGKSELNMNQYSGARLSVVMRYS